MPQHHRDKTGFILYKEVLSARPGGVRRYFMGVMDSFG